jgi:hypothetical protein
VVGLVLRQCVLLGIRSIRLGFGSELDLDKLGFMLVTFGHRCDHERTSVVHVLFVVIHGGKLD